MKKTLITLLIAAATGTAVVGLFASDGYGEHDSDDRHERSDHRKIGGVGGSGYLVDPQYALYQQECGDCHMAYPAAMLPAASWHGVMGSLADHFGDNAELDAGTAAGITAYLDRYSAGNGRGDYSDRMYRATRGQTPLRITETDYFIGQHHEIPRKMVKDNPEIKRFSHCEACHTRAADGSFDEHEVHIAGYGRWDD